ncbi:MAG: 16S rRNA (uracil(1498)-N(3))-methyltransferase [Alphaproteobacteria bacterium]
MKETGMREIHKTPRLYTDQDINAAAHPILNPAQAHYLKTVLRMEAGKQVRIFNGRSGEWAAKIETLSKKTASLKPEEQLKTQPSPPRALHLLFAPIKKNRLDFLIEKAVELGATDLHPIITDHTQIRTLKMPRLEAQIIETAEQCERLDLPKLHEICPLDKKIAAWTPDIEIYWASERLLNAQALKETAAPQAYLIGPEGGFSEAETTALLRCDIIRAISLGQDILRAETAAFYCLSHTKLCTEDENKK